MTSSLENTGLLQVQASDRCKAIKAPWMDVAGLWMAGWWMDDDSEQQNLEEGNKEHQTK